MLGRLPPARDPGARPRQGGPGRGGIPVVGAFDGYRALAIFRIVLFHIFLFCGVLGAVGDSAAGVVIFGILPRGSLAILFVVSGFVLFLPAAGRGGDFGAAGVRAPPRRAPPARLLAQPRGRAAAPGDLRARGARDRADATHVAMLQTPALLFDGPVTRGSPRDFALGLG